MRKKIVAFILIIVILASCVAVLTACNKSFETELELVSGSRPDYATLFTNEDKQIIDAALSEDATEDQKKEAVIALFNTANKSRKETYLSLMLQNSNAGIPFGDVIMHAFNLKSGDKWYYQLATQVSTGSPAVDAAITIFAGLLKIAYTTGDGTYYYSSVLGAVSECDCSIKTFPYATYVLTKEPVAYDEEAFKEEIHYLDSMHEINNMQFVKEIIADDAVITYDAEKRFYRVEFSVDMSADRELIEQWYAMAQKDMQVSGNSIKKYNYYDAVLEVWDNGYAKSYKSDSKREATGMASGKPKDEFTYIWKESEIMALLRTDESIDKDLDLPSPAEYIDYYSDPSTVAAKADKAAIGLIIGVILVCVIILAGIISPIVVNVLVKKGKLPKLAERRERRKQKRLGKKKIKEGKDKDGAAYGEEGAEYDLQDGEDILQDDEN